MAAQTESLSNFYQPGNYIYHASTETYDKVESFTGNAQKFEATLQEVNRGGQPIGDPRTTSELPGAQDKVVA